MKHYELTINKTIDEMKAIETSGVNTDAGDFNYLANVRTYVQKDQQTIEANSVINPVNDEYYYKEQKLDLVPGYCLKLQQKMCYYISFTGDAKIDIMSDDHQFFLLDNYVVTDHRKRLGTSVIMDKNFKLDELNANTDLIPNLNICKPTNDYPFLYSFTRINGRRENLSVIDTKTVYNQSFFVNIFGHGVNVEQKDEHVQLIEPLEDTTGNIQIIYDQPESNSDDPYFYKVDAIPDDSDLDQFKSYQGLPIGQGIYAVPNFIKTISGSSSISTGTPFLIFYLSVSRTPEV